MRLSNFLLWQAAYAELVFPVALLARFHGRIAPRGGGEFGTRVSAAMAASPRGAAREGRGVAALRPGVTCRPATCCSGPARPWCSRRSRSSRPGSAARRPGSSRRSFGGGRLARMGAAHRGIGDAADARHGWPFRRRRDVVAGFGYLGLGFVIAGGRRDRAGVGAGRTFWPAGRHRLRRRCSGSACSPSGCRPTLGVTAILFVFAIVWATDTGAYFAGRLDRRRQALAARFRPRRPGPARSAAWSRRSPPAWSSRVWRRPARGCCRWSRPLIAVGRLPAGRSLRIGRETPLRRQGCGHSHSWPWRAHGPGGWSRSSPARSGSP